MKTIEQLQDELKKAKERCDRLSKPAHMVGNCISDSERRDEAWRHLQSIQFQIRELEKQSWPFPPETGPVPWTPQQIAEYQRKSINDAEEALL